VLRQFLLSGPVTKLGSFILVGGVCSGLQIVIMHCFIALGWHEVSANALGFVISTQVNFVLSSLFTWRAQHEAWSWKTTSLKWLTFSLVALFALIVVTKTFTVLRYDFERSSIISSVGGIVLGSIVSIVLHQFVTFRPRRQPVMQVEAIPTESEVIEAASSRSGIAVFYPAHNEQDNLPTVVSSSVNYLRQLGRPFQVIIINDGSLDDTSLVADRLATTYPGEVSVVHHPVNGGYGQALRSGFRAGLDTGYDIVAFSDSDGQFRIDSLGTLLCALERGSADLAVGVRTNRADPLKRRIMGRSWHWFSSLVLGFRLAQDVDCGFKVFTRPALAQIYDNLRGEGAAISPEMLAHAKWRNLHIVEAPVNHFPRAAGEQSGADLQVIVKSILSLFRLRMSRKECTTDVAYASSSI